MKQIMTYDPKSRHYGISTCVAASNGALRAQCQNSQELMRALSEKDVTGSMADWKERHELYPLILACIYTVSMNNFLTNFARH